MSTGWPNGPMLTEIHVVTLFPEWFEHLKAMGLTGRALDDGRIVLRCFNPRQYVQDVHRSVDDRPYGGGPGMVMRPEPLAQAIEQARSGSDAPVSVLSRQGRRRARPAVDRLADGSRLGLVSGR